jgi:hypothetical protein
LEREDIMAALEFASRLAKVKRIEILAAWNFSEAWRGLQPRYSRFINCWGLQTLRSGLQILTGFGIIIFALLKREKQHDDIRIGWWNSNPIKSINTVRRNL